MAAGLDTLVDSLLYEGYALYPYTPGATKNATPTPFGIVYPPLYAAGNPATFDHAQMECVTVDASAPRATLHFLHATASWRSPAAWRKCRVARGAPASTVTHSICAWSNVAGLPAA